jgi:hypothetical protein
MLEEGLGLIGYNTVESGRLGFEKNDYLLFDHDDPTIIPCKIMGWM